MIDFVLNDRNIHTDAPPGGVLLNFLRYSRRLVGTKEACHGEGACGACLVLVGEWRGKAVFYRSMNACLLPLAEVEGKHIVTIEGLDDHNGHGLSPIQQAIVDEGATQCGYCTPGIVLALTGLFLDTSAFSEEQATAAISGNLCRCTGYQSIRRALTRLCGIFPSSEPGTGKTPMERLVEKGIVPPYFPEIPGRLRALSVVGEPPREIPPENTIAGGGTDLWLQRPDVPEYSGITYLSRREDLKGIRMENGRCHMGAGTTFQEMEDAKVMQDLFPDIGEYFQRIASKPIRHRATVGGNIVNASPIGDVTVFFLALDASIGLNRGGQRRELALKDFFLGYKKPDLKDNELVEEIVFPCRKKDKPLFHFEKVSKTTHQDIASVNSAIQVTMEEGVMARVHLSAGGVAPIPLYLSRTVAYLTGREPDVDCVRAAASLAQSEVSPISDARGSAEYKRLLLRQLIHAHFITLFPGRITWKTLV